MSFDTSVSSGYVSGLGHASLARKYAINVLRSIYGSLFLCIVMFTLLLPFATWLAPSYVLLGDMIGLVVKYNIPRDLHPRLPPPGLVMSELSNDAIWDLSPPTLLRLPFYCTPPADADAVIQAPTPEDLAAATPNTKVLAKAEASKKRRASTSGSASSEILLITPIRSAATIPLGDATGDAIDKDFFPFVPGPYYAEYSEDGIIVGSYEGLLKSHDDDYVQSSDTRLKSIQQRLTSFQGLESRVSGIKNLVTDLNDKVTASDAAFVKAKATGKERKKKIKSLSKSLDQFTTKAARLASDLNQVRRLARPAVVPAPKVAGVSPSSLKESNVTPASSLVDFLSKDAPPSSVAAIE
ncbi:hypothetical protein Tco_1427652 [Tanacetum coccineum]